MATLTAILHKEPQPVSEAAEGVPRELERVITSSKAIPFARSSIPPQRLGGWSRGRASSSHLDLPCRYLARRRV